MAILLSRGGFPASGETEIPIEFREGLIWVPVKVAGQERPLQLLLDSGASANVLDLGLVRRMGLPVGDRVMVSGVGSQVTGYWPVRAAASVAGLDLPGNFLGVDLRRLSKACGRPVEGLLGVEFFHGRRVEIDFRRERLRLHDARVGGSGDGVRLMPNGHGLLVELSVDGGPNRAVRVDTGCASALQWVTSSRVAAQRRRAVSAVGLSDLEFSQVLSGVRIGEHAFDTVPTGLHTKPWFPGESGLVGNGLLAMFESVTFDTVGGRLHFGALAHR